MRQEIEVPTPNVRAEGAILWAVSTDGRKLSELELDAVPAWDGVAAAGGKSC